MMTVEIEGVTLHLGHPDEIPIRWVGQEEVMRQLLAAWPLCRGKKRGADRTFIYHERPTPKLWRNCAPPGPSAPFEARQPEQPVPQSDPAFPAPTPVLASRGRASSQRGSAKGVGPCLGRLSWSTTGKGVP